MASRKVWVIIEIIEVMDVEGMKRYTQAVGAQLDAHGAKRLTAAALADGSLEIFEGATDAERILIHEWPSADAFKNWQSSAEYAELRALRLASNRLNILIVPAP